MIVFTDIDGTLYDYEGRMPESTREALRKLKENGHLVYFVTGRSKAENKKELWDMGLDGIICANGAYIEDRGEVIFHKTLSKDECAKIVDWCKERDL
ncbi:MAG: HAD-IIB family hydrolase, partial [Erysipelotrichaceae bacterium]|nr:HAD-IIB family hydrolase [Erysipelotrichaceae bacterium]